jgi:hypothetical protein
MKSSMYLAILYELFQLPFLMCLTYINLNFSEKNKTVERKIMENNVFVDQNLNILRVQV